MYGTWKVGQRNVASNQQGKGPLSGPEWSRAKIVKISGFKNRRKGDVQPSAVGWVWAVR